MNQLNSQKFDLLLIKQYPGVMESENLPIEKRRELQKLAYTLLPKKKISEYIEKLNLRTI